MVKQKRKITSSKAPQKTVLPTYIQSESGSPEETPLSSGSDDSRNRSSSSVDQDGNDGNTSDQSNTTSSSDGFGRIPIRSRRRFAPEETEVLEQAYKKSKRPTNEVKQRLAQDMDTTISRIQIWFQNRRAKEKKLSESSNNQKTSTTDQNSNTDEMTSPEMEDHEATATSRNTPNARKKKKVRKSESPPPSSESSSAARQRKRQKQPGSVVVPPVVPHQLLHSGSYPMPYPNFTHAFQPFDPSSAAGTQMPNENVLYPLPPRRVYLPEYDWQPPPHFYHQPLQRPFPYEKPVKYVDPKKMAKSESFAATKVYNTHQSDNSPSRQGKLKQKASDQDGNFQEDTPETGDL